MAKVTKLQAQLGAPNRVPGQYHVRVTKRGLVFQKWPRKRGKGSTPANFYKETEFGLAASYASNPDPFELVAAIAAAKGVPMVPRDFLTGCCYGTVVSFAFEDGSQWTRYRDVTINAQLVLDQVTDTVGAMMYRSSVGWVEIPPGVNGSFLFYQNLTPTWAPSAPPIGTTPTNAMYALLNPTTAAAIAVNTIGGIACTLQAGTIINALNFYCSVAAPTTRIAAAIYARNANNPGARLALSSQIIGATVGIKRVPLDAPYLITTTDLYFLALSVTTALVNQASSNATIWGWGAASAYPPPANMGAITASYASTWPKIWID